MSQQSYKIESDIGIIGNFVPMKILKISALLIFSALFHSCDNEVDLNAEFKDTPVVFGLLDAGSDTNYIRVTRGFLKDGENAINLAQDPSLLYYDSLNVNLTQVDNGSVFPLKRINIPKESGVFSKDNNRVYILESPLVPGKDYKLNVEQPDGSVASATAKTLGFVQLDKPDPARPTLEVSFVNNNLNYQNYDFQFDVTRSIAKFEAYLYFFYDEIDGATKTRKQVRMPIGSFTNSNLENIDGQEINFPGQRFFQTIADDVPLTALEKEIPADSNLMIEVYAADQTLLFYQDLNGPIDGLAQVRPEFSNIDNGVGLLASRSVRRYFTRLNGDSRNELKNGSLTGNHNFSDP